MICADDFGMAEDINRATAELSQAGKIDAVSCMVNAPFFLADEFAMLCPDVKTGLHFTLTETFAEFLRLTGRAYARQIKRCTVYAELSKQFDRFREITGQNPDFIDGHLHIQQLPVVRDAVIDFILINKLSSILFVRNAAIPLRQCTLKSLLISLPGHALKRKLRKAGIPTNNGFGGIYSYSKFIHYPQYLKTFLSTVSDKGIIMVHPGLNEPWRRVEYDMLRAQ
jgi:predicted glycoside hydrolase/deacetylase ChbG (UPF0249 family)